MYSKYKYEILQLDLFHVRDLSETEEENRLLIVLVSAVLMAHQTTGH
jgi:hypothetical protein